MKTTRYAVNVADLTTLGPIASILLADCVPNKILVQCEAGRVDGSAVVLECDDERAQAIVAVIRMKHPKYKVRCYRGSKRI